MQIKLIGHFIFQVFCLTGISLVSDYHVPDLTESNWETVLFLTPLGIIKNFLSTNPVMRSFYRDYSPGQMLLTNWQLVLILVILLVQFFNFYKLMRLIKE